MANVSQRNHAPGRGLDRLVASSQSFRSLEILILGGCNSPGRHSTLAMMRRGLVERRPVARCITANSTLQHGAERVGMWTCCCADRLASALPATPIWLKLAPDTGSSGGRLTTLAAWYHLM